jgi:hypothetical protein
MSTQRLTLPLFLASMVGIVAAPARGQIGNGGFEAPDVAIGFLPVAAGSGLIPSWTVGDVSVDVVEQDQLVAPAFEGTQFLDLDGTPGPGSVSQTFPTTAGQLYLVTFAYANNFQASVSPGTAAAVRAFDSSGNLLGPLEITHSSSMAGNLNWDFFSATFMPNASSATLEFDSLSAAGSNGGILIDGVEVRAVAEPSCSILGLLAGAALAARRKARICAQQ